MVESNGFLIWWTHDNCEENPSWKSDTPEYIVDEYTDRVGRAGRGRLWCASGMPKSILTEWPKNQFCNDLAEKFGVIVINIQDLRFISDMPGLVTDLMMNKKIKPK